jgi:hypothetical protein
MRDAGRELRGARRATRDAGGLGIADTRPKSASPSIAWVRVRALTQRAPKRCDETTRFVEKLSRFCQICRAELPEMLSHVKYGFDLH